MLFRLNATSKKDVSVQITLSGTATLGTDYSSGNTSLVIPAGATSTTFTISAIQDNTIEGDETVVVTLSSVSNALLLDTAVYTLTLGDDDKDSDGDGVPDSDDACHDLIGTASTAGCPPGSRIIFNEVMYDPSDVGLAGDANGDGAYNQGQDEFIEFYNASDAPSFLEGVTVSDSVIASGTTTVRYTFAAGTKVPARKALVLFGGGVPVGAFGGATMLVCTTADGLSLGNSGEFVVVKDGTGKVLLRFNSDELSNNPNESYTRSPDITGKDPFVQHGSVRAGVLFSPGTQISGAPF
jgi:hypothetical protein